MPIPGVEDRLVDGDGEVRTTEIMGGKYDSRRADSETKDDEDWIGEMKTLRTVKGGSAQETEDWGGRGARTGSGR